MSSILAYISKSIALVLALSAAIQPLGMRVCSCDCRSEQSESRLSSKCSDACGKQCRARACSKHECEECPGTQLPTLQRSAGLCVDWHLCECPEGCDCEVRQSTRSTFLREASTEREVEETASQPVCELSYHFPIRCKLSSLLTVQGERSSSHSLTQLCRFII